jgi:hypothetical protein
LLRQRKRISFAIKRWIFSDIIREEVTHSTTAINNNNLFMEEAEDKVLLSLSNKPAPPTSMQSHQ